MDVGEYVLQNPDKVDRAINGSVVSGGMMKGGVGQDASEDAIIAEYDRIGGLILYKGYKVKTGCFYDFKKKMAVKKPEPILEFKVDGETIEVPVGEPLPMEIRAANEAKKRKAEKAAAKAAAKAEKAGKKNKKAAKDEDESDDEDEKDTDDEEGELA